MIPYELLQDLNKLACTSKNKKIEELFLKLAQESQDGFYQWLSKNRGNKVLLSRLQNSKFLGDLNYLANNHEKLAKNWFYLIGDKKWGHLPHTFLILDKLSNQKEFETALKPFQSALSNFKAETTEEEKAAWEAEEEKIKFDLRMLLREYDSFLKGNSNITSPIGREKVIDKRELKRRKKELGYVDTHRWPDDPRVRKELEKVGPPVTNTPEKKPDVGRTSDMTTMSEEERIVLYRKAFGYLLDAFTQLILQRISQSKQRQEVWSGLEAVLRQGYLPKYDVVLDNLPYIPDMADSGAQGEKIFNELPKNFKSYGNVGAFNILNREITKSLKLPGFSGEVEKEEVDDFDYGAWLREKGDPEHATPDTVRTNPIEDKAESEKQELAARTVLQCEYIFFVSVLLNRIKQYIQQSRVITS